MIKQQKRTVLEIRGGGERREGEGDELYIRMIDSVPYIHRVTESFHN